MNAAVEAPREVRAGLPPDIDPITFAVVKSALDTIVDEMAYTVIRTARSEIVKDVMDYSAALCDARGRMIAQAKTIALHLGAIPEAIEAVLAAYRDDLAPGDVIIMNDPYEGGMHLPDIFMFMPYFHEGVLVAFGVVICHHTDMGGRVAGSNASDSTEIFQEGLRIPPLKLYGGGRPNRTLRRLIEKNVRVPDRVLGDLEAQHATCRVGAREVGRLIGQLGPVAFERYIDALLDYTENLARDEIRRWPDGTYRFTDYIDDAGVGGDEPLPIMAAVTVEGDSLTVDFTGSAPQVRAALNSTLSYTHSCAYLSVRCMLAPELPNNAGLFRCVEVVAPPASILNPTMPAACAARALTGYRVVDALFGALAQIVPDRVPAAGEGGNTVVCIGGYRTDRSPFIIVDMICGAWGGRPDGDGVEAITNPSQNLSNTPVEVLEAQHPVRIEAYELIPDSCGAGRFRGGVGIARSYRLLAEEAHLQLRADRVRFAPYGLAGGKPGRRARNLLFGNGQEGPRDLPGKVSTTLRRGEMVRHEQAGAGGFGDPLTRDPILVLEDVRAEKVTVEYARSEHGVIIDAARLALDSAATAAFRAKMVAPTLQNWSATTDYERED